MRPLGSQLYEEYARLLLAWGGADDAHRAAGLAITGGTPQDPDVVGLAELAREEAAGRLYAFKERVAQDLLLALRFAADLYPGRLADLVGPDLVGRLRAVEERIDFAEWAIAELEAGRVVR